MSGKVLFSLSFALLFPLPILNSQAVRLLFPPQKSNVNNNKSDSSQPRESSNLLPHKSGIHHRLLLEIDSAKFGSVNPSLKGEEREEFSRGIHGRLALLLVGELPEGRQSLMSGGGAMRVIAEMKGGNCGNVLKEGHQSSKRKEEEEEEEEF